MSLSVPHQRLPEVAALSWDDCRLLVESVADYAIFMLDAKGHVATWNIGAEKIKGYKASEIIGQHFSKFYVSDDIAAGKPAQKLAIAEELGHVEDEGWRVRKDGSRFWANVIITALRDENGRLRGFGKITRDLTERRRAEEALRSSEERFRLLVESVGDYAIYMLDPEGRVVTWNLGAERMKGYEAHEIIGKFFSVFFPEDDIRSGKPARELAVARAEGRFEDEGFRIRKDGTRFWAKVTVTPVWGAQGQLLGFGKVTRDLTAREEAQRTVLALESEKDRRAAAEHREARRRENEEAAQQNAKKAQEAALRAEEANRFKDEFLATVSHELRTPLNAILGWASVLRARTDDPSLSRGLDAIHRNAHIQARIVEDILDVSRVMLGKLRLDLKPTDLIAIVKEAIEIVRPSAVTKHISIDLMPTSHLTVVVGDPERLRQVVCNLLSNAVKFTDAEGSVLVSIEPAGSSMSVSVRDTGQGIDPEFLPHVFERFRQADGSTSRRFGGLGLGLAIVRQIVELHGGHVHAESRGKGQGALFTVILPIPAILPPFDETMKACPRAESVGERAALTGLRVLVVDDEADARELLEHVLGEAGAVVETAGSAAAGLDAVQRFRPHVLVSDIGMPGEDGYSLMRRLRELQPSDTGGIPSIALTAYTRGEDRTRALAAGFTTHVGKPVSPPDLVAAVANLGAFARR